MTPIKLETSKEIESANNCSEYGSVTHNPMSEEFKKFLLDNAAIDKTLEESLDLLD